MSTAHVHHVAREVASLAPPVEPTAPLSPSEPSVGALLPVELTAQAADACTWCNDPRTRSATLDALVREIYETTIWRIYGDETCQTELASLRRVVAEVDAHRWRMGLARGLDG